MRLKSDTQRKFFVLWLVASVAVGFYWMNNEQYSFNIISAIMYVIITAVILAIPFVTVYKIWGDKTNE